jgi:hypothetical protein
VLVRMLEVGPFGMVKSYTNLYLRRRTKRGSSSFNIIYTYCDTRWSSIDTVARSVAVVDYVFTWNRGRRDISMLPKMSSDSVGSDSGLVDLNETEKTRVWLLEFGAMLVLSTRTC